MRAKNNGLKRALAALSASVDADVNDVVKKIRMDLSDQIDYYWDLAKKETDPEQKAALNAAAEYLRKIHQSSLMNTRFVS